MDNLTYEIKQYFNVLDIQTEWIQVLCPYHADTRPSAGINIRKQWFNCFTCGSKTFNEVYIDHIAENTNGNPNENNGTIQMSEPLNFLNELTSLITKQTGKSYRVLKEITPEECKKYLRATIISKGVSADTLTRLKVEPVLDVKENLYGYMKFPINESDDFVARKFLPDEIIAGERYLNPKGEKPYYGDINDKETDYILVEGIFDYISLMENGYPNVICNLGTAMNDKRAYLFRNKIVFILFDSDYAGFTGAQKAYNILRKVQANPIILDLPKVFGKDINEAIVKNKDEVLRWLENQVKVFDSSDENYILDFNKQDSLYTLKTGMTIIDRIYGGGLKIGMHAIAAEPGVGKTALSLFLAHNIVLLNPEVKVLYNTYEVPKSQCWARLASMYDEHTWTEIETNPTILSERAKTIAGKLAEKIRVVAMWDINEIVRAARNYDVIVIDYIQRMPGDTADEKSNTKRNTKELSKLMMEQDKIIILISSIPRVAYGKEDLSVFKECGDIEFCIQSGLLLKDINHGGEDRMLNVVVLKNTRGESGGNFWLKGDMTHNLFQEIQPDLG